METLYVITILYILPVIANLIDWNFYNWKNIHTIGDMIIPKNGINVFGERDKDIWIMTYMPVVNIMLVSIIYIKIIAFFLFDLLKIHKLVKKFLNIKIK